MIIVHHIRHYTVFAKKMTGNGTQAKTILFRTKPRRLHGKNLEKRHRFREARTVPAVEYLQANRLRTLAIKAMHEKLSGIDVYVNPSWQGESLLLTNLTDHPAVVVPNGLRKEQTPSSITSLGRLFGEDKLLAVAKAYQDATSFHLKHPVL